jgi:putative Mn2+ efflux pump MntP
MRTSKLLQFRRSSGKPAESPSANHHFYMTEGDRMSLLAAMILASFAANVDNVGIGIEKTSKGERIPFQALFALFSVTAVFSSLAVQLGLWLEGKIPSQYVEWTCGILLGFVGLRVSLPGQDPSRKVALLERKWWMFAFSQSLNNLSMGLSGGFLGFHPVLFGITLGGASSFLLWTGTRIGIRLQSTHIAWMHRLGGAFLLLIAALQVLR